MSRLFKTARLIRLIYFVFVIIRTNVWKIFHCIIAGIDWISIMHAYLSKFKSQQLLFDLNFLETSAYNPLHTRNYSQTSITLVWRNLVPCTWRSLLITTNTFKSSSLLLIDVPWIKRTVRLFTSIPIRVTELLLWNLIEFYKWN